MPCFNTTSGLQHCLWYNFLINWLDCWVASFTYVGKSKQGETSSCDVETAVDKSPQQNKGLNYVQEAKILLKEFIFDLLQEILQPVWIY